MEVQRLKEKLTSIFSTEEITLELYMVVGNTIKFANLSDDSIKNLLILFQQSISDIFLDDETEYRLKYIDDINDEDAHTYYYFDNENIYEKLEDIVGFTGEDTDSFSFDDYVFSDVDTFLIKIGTDDNHIILYKKNFPINLMKRGNVLFFMKSNENIDELKEDILKVDRNFQFLAIDGHVIIVNLKILENQLGYESVIIKKAEEALLTLSAIDFVDDIDKLRDMIKSKRIAKKFNLVKDSPVIDIINTDRSKVVSFIKSHPKLKKSLKFNDEGKLELKTKVSVEKFLKLLDDDYLKSELTDLLYESLNKDALKTEDA